MQSQLAVGQAIQESFDDCDYNKQRLNGKIKYIYANTYIYIYIYIYILHIYKHTNIYTYIYVYIFDKRYF